MNIRFLESFVWLSRLKNFRETAEKLNTTQPNITSRISSLEDHLRTRLYVRESREFQLTSAGRMVLQHAEQILHAFEAMKAAVQTAEADQPVLKVGIIELITLSWLPAFVATINKADPPIEVHIVTETSDNLVQMLRQDELDLIFIWGPANEPNVINEYICHYALEWMCETSLAPHNSQLDIVDLAKLPVIPQRKGTSSYAPIHEYFSAYGMAEAPETDRRVSVTSYSIATAIELIRSGVGIMAMAPLMLRNEIETGAVKILSVRQELAPVYLTACYKTPTNRASLERVLDFAREASAEFSKSAPKDFFWI